MALDESGATLRKTLELVDLKSPGVDVGTPAFTFETMRLGVPKRGRRTNGEVGIGISLSGGASTEDSGESSRERSPGSVVSPGESASGGYFDAVPGRGR